MCALLAAFSASEAASRRMRSQGVRSDGRSVRQAGPGQTGAGGGALGRTKCAVHSAITTLSTKSPIKSYLSKRRMREESHEMRPAKSPPMKEKACVR